MTSGTQGCVGCLQLGPTGSQSAAAPRGSAVCPFPLSQLHGRHEFQSMLAPRRGWGAGHFPGILAPCLRQMRAQLWTSTVSHLIQTKTLSPCGQ